MRAEIIKLCARASRARRLTERGSQRDLYALLGVSEIMRSRRKEIEAERS